MGAEMLRRIRGTGSGSGPCTDLGWAKMQGTAKPAVAMQPGQAPQAAVVLLKKPS